MSAFAIIGFWAAVIGGVMMYVVAGREVVEALRELLRKPKEAVEQHELERARLGLLATAFVGRPVAVAIGEGVAVDSSTDAPLRIAVPDPSSAAAKRDLIVQAGRLSSGGYRRVRTLTDQTQARRYRKVLDAGLISQLSQELPGAPWTANDHALARAFTDLKGDPERADNLPTCDVPWRVESIETMSRAAPERKIAPSEGLDARKELTDEAPKRLTKESEEERQGIFFIRFESIQEWTEDFLDLDRPAEDDGSSDGKQSTGTITRKATASSRTSGARRSGEKVLGQEVTLLPEWDVDRGGYKSNYCRAVMREAWVPESDDALDEMETRLAADVRRLERHLEMLTFHRRRERRSSSGSEVDLDAWVRFQANLRAGATCDASRLYLRTCPARRPLTIATLVDLSASTEAPCGGRRVVDLERDALYLLSKAIERVGDVHAAWGFTSSGASQVQLFRLKDFDEKVEACAQRLAGLGPYANTRMGAAIRRVIPEIASRGGQGRLLFVVTDGKPHDDDGYAGAYAFADTRRAIEEARAANIRVVGIGIGSDAQEGVRELFSPYFVSVERVEALPRTLASLYVKVAGHGARS